MTHTAARWRISWASLAGLMAAGMAIGLPPLACTPHETARGYAYDTLDLADGRTMAYAIVRPPGFDARREYPVLLAFPGGAQDRAMVEWALDGYWAAEARRREWIVVSPVAPAGGLLFERVADDFARLATHLGRMLRPRGGKLYLAGISNGGISAFRAAMRYPELVQGLLVLPGVPPSPGDFERLGVLVGIPVAMFVGAHDTSWISRIEATARALSAAGGTVRVEILPGEGHLLRSLEGGARLFDVLDAMTQGRIIPPTSRTPDEPPAAHR